MCQLENGERIHTVHIYVGYYYYGVFKVAQALLFITNQKTCGPYGQTTDERVTVSGHQLLYITGRIGALFDKLNLYFDYGCE